MVVEARSDYWKSYLWWRRNIACGDSAGGSRIGGGRVRVPPGLAWGWGVGGVIWCVGVSLDDLANGGFVSFFFTHGMVLVLWGVDIILGDGYGIWGIWGQAYVALIQASAALAGFRSGNWVLGIWCFGMAWGNVCWWLYGCGVRFSSLGSFSCGWGRVASCLGVRVLVGLASGDGVGCVVSVVWRVCRGLAWLALPGVRGVVWVGDLLLLSGFCYVLWILVCGCLA